MRSRLTWPVVFLLAIGAAGCSTPNATYQALDAAQRAVAADEVIVDTYHDAVMEAFDHAREEHVAEAKRIADRLAADGKLTPEVAQEGGRRLQASLAEVERRRAKFQELRRLAEQNHERAHEVLAIAADGLTLRSTARAEAQALVEQVIERAQQGAQEGETP